MKILTDPRSGSYQGLTASRNRNGQYVRTRAIPVQPRTNFQSTIRSQLSANSAAWRALTALQMAAWASLGLQMIRSDSLGQRNTLTGSQTHNSINMVLGQYLQPYNADAPLLTTPSDVATVVISAASLGPAMTVTTTGEPLSGFIGIYAAPPVTAGRTFIQGFRLILTAAVGGSPYNVLSAWTGRFGTLISGQKCAFIIRTMQDGFESLGAPASAVAT
jgi:hypothetical protein